MERKKLLCSLSQTLQVPGRVPLTFQRSLAVTEDLAKVFEESPEQAQAQLQEPQGIAALFVSSLKKAEACKELLASAQPEAGSSAIPDAGHARCIKADDAMT